MADIKFYTNPMSRGQIVRWMLEEVGEPYDTHILDYKTNDIATDTPDEQLLAPYELQLGVYAHAVEQWFGEPPRELSLIMLRPSARRVSVTWSIDFRERIRVRVAQVIESLQQGRR